MLISQCHFDEPPLDLISPLKKTAFLKPMGPGVIVPPALPLGAPSEHLFLLFYLFFPIMLLMY